MGLEENCDFIDDSGVGEFLSFECLERHNYMVTKAQKKEAIKAFSSKYHSITKLSDIKVHKKPLYQNP